MAVRHESNRLSALRTISLRLRGTSVEILEEMGEETDNVVESTSKLQEKIKALSGIDILTDAGDYKDTYTILKEIGNVWEDMSDIDQAALLELMAGKNRANTLSAILSNMEDLEGAYESAMNAEGSALKENEAYLDSIQGRIDLFNNSLQTMWMNTLDSDMVKTLVDIATAAIKVADAFGLIPTAIGGFVGVKAIMKEVKANLDAITQSTITSTAAKQADTAATQAHTAAENSDIVAEKANEVATQGNTAASWKDVAATNAQTAATKALAIAKGVLKGVGKAALTTIVAMAATKLFEGLYNIIDKAAHKAEYLKEEVTELKETYENAKDTFEDNIVKLTVSSDTDTYATLEDEFKQLTKGVSENGDNISLTSDQYERYKQICETIVGLNPKLAARYDSVTKAVGNNADTLAQLIELQKIEARSNIMEYIKDDNLQKISTDALNDYKTAIDNVAKAESELESDLLGTEQYVINPLDSWFSQAENIPEELQKTYDDFVSKFYTNGIFDKTKVTDATEFETYVNNIDTLGKSLFENFTIFGDTDLLGINLDESFNDLESAKSKLEEAKDGLVTTLMQIPESMKEFDELTDADKSFLNEWIENSPMFQIDENTTAEKVLEYKSTIRQIVADLANGDYTKELKNETTISASDIVDQIINLDSTTVNWAQYREQLNVLLSYLWDAIGGKHNTFGFKNKHDLALSFGIDIQLEDQAERDMIARYAEIKGITAEQAKAYFDSLPPEEVQRLLKIEWSAVGQDNIDDVMNPKRIGDATYTQSYVDLNASVESYNELLSQTREIVHDNMQLSDEYYNTLKEQLSDVTVAGEGFADAIDETNGKVVKNAKLLKQLIDQSRKAKKATIEVAKSQAQLEYGELVKEIRRATVAMGAEYMAYGYIRNATLDNISGMRDQLALLKQTIQQYALLEISLSEAAQAYNEYELAKERDAKITYDDSFVEMLKTIDQGILQNRTGTEEFEYAVRAIVPEDIWSGITDPDEKIKSIHDYIDGDATFAKLFTVDNESGDLSVTADNVREFITMCEDAGLVEGSPTGFTLTDKVDGIESFAKVLGVTEAAALALLSATEDVDALWGNILTDVTTAPLEREVNKQVNAIDSAAEAMENYLDAVKRGEQEFNKNTYDKLVEDLNEANQAYDLAEEKANRNAQTYTTLQAALSAYRGNIKLTKEEANALAKALGYVDEHGQPTIHVNEDGSLQLADDQVQDLLIRLGALEEPAIMRVQLQYDEISSEIDQIQQYIDNECVGTITIDGITIANHVDAEAKLNELTLQKKEIEVTYNITETSTEEEKSVLESYQELAKNGLNFTATANVTQATDSLKDVSDAQGKIKENQPITITAPGASTTEQAIKNIADELDRIKSKTITLTVTKTETAIGTKTSGTVGALGNAFASGNIGLKSAENDAVVGELGTEMVVDPIRGIYYTVGENGTEMVNLPKGAIIYNHKQTEELLKNGRTTRGHSTGGLSFAKGNAHLTPSYGIPSYHPNTEASTSFANGLEINNAWDDATSALSDALDDAADSVNEFEETIDWIEIRMEEYDERINKFSAELENLTTYSSKNDKLDQIIEENKKKYADSLAGAAYYENYAKKYLEGMNDNLVAAAKNGAIAITEFTKEQDEATVEAIQNYRDYAQKAADLYQQAEEIITEIRDSVIQKIDNIQSYGDAKTSIEDLQTEKLQSAVDYLETSGYVPSTIYYGSNGGDAASSTGMFENSYKKIDYWQPLLDDMQAQLNEAVQNGQIKVGTIEWYEQIEKLYQVRAEIDAATLEIEEFQNAINDIYWDNFDQLISQYDNLESENQNLIDLLGTEKMLADPEKQTMKGGTTEFWTADDVQFTKEGIASMGLYAQQMETAQHKAEQYEKAMEDLTADYEAGKYSEAEYAEKLAELKDGQYEAIKSYHDAEDAIVDLQKARVESIKEGIEKEIDAYDELIQKKKEELSAEKDLYDFQKQVRESSKNISDIERQLAALSADNSASVRAKRAQLEAELAEARAEQEDLYYNRSIEKQQEALDKENEDFQESKEKEMEMWDEYLTNVETVLAESLGLVQENANGVYTTLNEYADEYGLNLSEEVVAPWTEGSGAISSYQETFGTASSATMEALDQMNLKWQELIATMQEASEQELEAINNENAQFAAVNEKSYSGNSSSGSAPSNSNNSGNSGGSGESTPKPSLTAGSYVEVKPGTRWYADSYGGGASGTAKSGTIKYVNEKGSHAYNIDGLGWIKKTDIKGYSVGSTGVEKDQWAFLHELGDELVLAAGPNGKLQYITKGTAIVPHDISENLMELGQLDPSDVLNRNKPEITPSKSIVSTEINLDCSVGTLVNIEHCDQNTLPDVEKMVNKAFEKHMQNLNNSIRKFAR